MTKHASLYYYLGSVITSQSGSNKPINIFLHISGKTATRQGFLIGGGIRYKTTFLMIIPSYSKFDTYFYLPQPH